MASTAETPTSMIEEMSAVSEAAISHAVCLPLVDITESELLRVPTSKRTSSIKIRRVADHVELRRDQFTPPGSTKL